MHKLYHQIDNISGSVVTLRAEGVKNKELAEIDSRTGTSLAHVRKLPSANALPPATSRISYCVFSLRSRIEPR